ncbi:MvaI/BcnI family restriction endonuclease [Pseudomonas alloputida]|uniref:MvaI/BcnI family restriction endonuclease n=1 Tax=Pseudomonas alloputida TaxID=1940621 RepID=UPI001E5BD8E9|nr:MvaI/BcnI family restriction endonuclease [Pseudomonas alloputida]MCE1054980.1 MvaI/BcnI family restriction endonuclease [Pseudomonas alloputida]
MTHTLASFEHHASSLADIENLLRGFGVDKMLLKLLPKNANDKNQIYFLRSLMDLHAYFDMTVSERSASSSLSKANSKPGDNIPEATFNNFHWVDTNKQLVRASNVKAIVYTQYPEVRLSGFSTDGGTMPTSLSVAFTQEHPEAKRLLVLGHMPGGGCLAFMFVDFDDDLERQISTLPGFKGSRVCKALQIPQNYIGRLFDRFKTDVMGRAHSGFRLNVMGERIPFDGTQVCGYTLEGLLGIVPNSGKDGDIYGIELKAHTTPKVTLFTTEPDFGLYVDNFEKMIKTYGYEASPGEWRLTGIHRADIRCAKSGLTLQVREYKPVDPEDIKSDWVRDDSGARISFPYDPTTPLTSKMNGVEVVLTDKSGVVAAGWSLDRLMNHWGAKHNDVMYLPAKKSRNLNTQDFDNGFTYQVEFSSEFIWCRSTSVERLLKAIADGLIYLDPGHKFVANDRSKNKRRCQWRVNDIYSCLPRLYTCACTMNVFKQNDDPLPVINFDLVS